MKKIIVAAVLCLLFSCTQKKADYTILSGKMTNTKEGKFTVRGNSFKKEIVVAEDGSFTDTLNIDYNGAYEIGRQEVYLHKGKNLTFDANAEELSSMTFTGDLAPENTYIAQRAKLLNDVMGNNPREFYVLDEVVFLSKVDELSEQQEALLSSTIFTVNEFKEKEKQNLSYSKEVLCSTYRNYHGRLIGNPDFKVSDNFPQADGKLDYDNADDYNFSTAYRNLVQLNFNNKIEEEIGDEYDEDKYNQVALKHFKAIKSQNIKNSLAKMLSYAVSPSNGQSEALYNELMANVTDENFKKELTEQFEKIKNLVKGKPSPKFDYENYKGGKTSLDDFKGKYVYIDVWATWCGPCKREIPFLKEVEHKYKGRNIEIVSISIDTQKDYETWKSFVKENNLGGVQLYADNDWKSQFVVDYGIQGIPRFILVDTEGNIVSADAPRPSDPKLIALFDELGI